MAHIHLELSSGIAGDMVLGACLELGLPLETLRAALDGLRLPGWRLETRQEQRGGLAGTRVMVTCHEEHHHRHLEAILAIIGASTLPIPVQERAAAIFRLLAEAEGAVHGIPPEQVHFHEVGAIDAIIDICGAAFALWHLKITSATATPLTTGFGTVRGSHGTLPVPAPAVAELIRRGRIPIRAGTVEMERATPTGVAILLQLQPSFTPPTLRRIHRVGCGLGGREVADQANALRIILEEDAENPRNQEIRRETVTVLTAHIDDMNPEWYGPLWELLPPAGALDVALIPMTMKKGRPAVRLEVVVAPASEEAVAHLILRHTSTLGVRVLRQERYILPRTHESISTPWGAVRVVRAGGVARVEHDDLALLARRMDWPLPQAWQQLAPFVLALGEPTSQPETTAFEEL